MQLVIICIRLRYSPIMFWTKSLLTVFLVVFCLVLVSFSASEKLHRIREEQPKPLRIAVIGGGIGGTSSAFFLRQLFGERAFITLFEKDVIGGRLATVDIAGGEYETGGSIIHPRNTYMNKFVRDFGLKKRQKPAVRTTGIFNGEEFVYQSSSWSLITFLKLLWRYGFDVIRMNWTLNGLFTKFERIYDFQDAGEVYSTPEEILEAMGGADFSSWMSTPISSVLKDEGFSDRFVTELLAVATRANYGQDPDMMAFAGMSSLAGAMPGTWSVEDGNKRVPEEFMKRSGATLIQSRVHSVERIQQDAAEKPSFSVTWNTGEDQRSDEFDVVIVAIPLGQQFDKSIIEFKGFGQPIYNVTGKFRHTVATLIQGQLRPSAFGVASLQDLSDQIITNLDVPNKFRTVSKNYPVDYDPKRHNESSYIYKIFSTEEMTGAQLDTIFESRSEVVHRNWLAYPYYRQSDSHPGFTLSEGVFFPSAIEWATSAMEMAVIGGRNSALLAKQYWGGISQERREGKGSGTDEL